MLDGVGTTLTLLFAGGVLGLLLRLLAALPSAYSRVVVVGPAPSQSTKLHFWLLGLALAGLFGVIVAALVVAPIRLQWPALLVGIVLSLALAEWVFQKARDGVLRPEIAVAPVVAQAQALAVAGHLARSVLKGWRSHIRDAEQTSQRTAAPKQPSRPHLLTRSTRDYLLVGVAGGMAEYFNVDPTLVRAIWVLIALVSNGLAVPVYILAWIILPRDDRPLTSGPYHWRDWSQEFHDETQRLAEEARRVAGESGHAWRAPLPGQAGSESVTDKSTPTTTPPPAPEDTWWTSEQYVEPHRHHGRQPRSAGIILVGLGVLLLAANAGVFSWIEWRTIWPLIFIALGLVLLVKQAAWRR